MSHNAYSTAWRSGLELVIGVNDDEIIGPIEPEKLWDTLVAYAISPQTWKLDLELRDGDGYTLQVWTLFEREA